MLESALGAEQPDLLIECFHQPPGQIDIVFESTHHRLCDISRQFIDLPDDNPPGPIILEERGWVDVGTIRRS